ncbi:hypothetical protein, partial [Winogradskya consettensis]|uniref:hypothetical protein n=1 Tax=Winogradskya consettensis TaxID=113560 RepID=UPI001BB3A22E
TAAAVLVRFCTLDSSGRNATLGAVNPRGVGWAAMGAISPRGVGWAAMGAISPRGVGWAAMGCG